MEKERKKKPCKCVEEKDNVLDGERKKRESVYERGGGTQRVCERKSSRVRVRRKIACQMNKERKMRRRIACKREKERKRKPCKSDKGLIAFKYEKERIRESL